MDGPRFDTLARMYGRRLVLSGVAGSALVALGGLPVAEGKKRKKPSKRQRCRRRGREFCAGAAARGAVAASTAAASRPAPTRSPAVAVAAVRAARTPTASARRPVPEPRRAWICRWACCYAIIDYLMRPTPSILMTLSCIGRLPLRRFSLGATKCSQILNTKECSRWMSSPRP